MNIVLHRTLNGFPDSEPWEMVRRLVNAGWDIFDALALAEASYYITFHWPIGDGSHEPNHMGHLIVPRE